MPLATNKVGGEQLTRLHKKKNKAGLEIGILIPCHPFKDKREGSIEDCIGAWQNSMRVQKLSR